MWRDSLLRIAHERRESVTSLGLLGNLGGIIFCRTGLRPVENDNLLLLKARRRAGQGVSSRFSDSSSAVESTGKVRHGDPTPKAQPPLRPECGFRDEYTNYLHSLASARVHDLGPAAVRVDRRHANKKNPDETMTLDEL